jgi:hypothetical protein
VSFWLPGQFDSFAAVQAAPGFSLPVVYYHYSGSAGAEAVLPRGRLLTAGMHADIDLAFIVPTYTFRPAVIGQLSLSVSEVIGSARIGVDATLSGPDDASRSGARKDSVTGFGDLYPMAALRWKHHMLSALWYVTGGIPLGVYGADRLANLGTHHWSVDSGGGLTLLHPTIGTEFSAVVGTTYNFENPASGYRNGISVHVDAALSQFFTKSLHVGAVGYLYNQLTSDSAPDPMPDGLKSRVYSVGPQVGYFLDVGSYQPYLNVRSYFEFEAKNRPEGFGFWFTVAIPFSPVEPTDDASG